MEEIKEKLEKANKKIKETIGDLETYNSEYETITNITNITNHFKKGGNIINMGNGDIYVNNFDLDFFRQYISSLEKNIELLKNDIRTKDEIIKAKNEEIKLLKMTQSK